MIAVVEWLRAYWGWVVAVAAVLAMVVVAFNWRDDFACWIGYAAMVDGGLNRGGRFFRDFVIALSAAIGIWVLWRNGWWQRIAAKVCKWFCALSAPAKWGTGIVAALAIVAVIFGWADFFGRCLGYAGDVAENVKGDNGTKEDAGICTSHSAGLFRREFLIAVVTLVGVGALLWRTIAFDRQTKNAENRLLSERFATAAELMAKETYDGKSALVARVTGNNISENKPAITARISGIHIMEKLAIDAPKEFAEQVVKNLIAYIKEHAQMTATPKLQVQVIPAEPRILGADVKAAFDVLDNILSIPQIKEMIKDEVLDFSRANFSGLNLNLEHVRLYHYKRFIETDFRGADLKMAIFRGEANLRGAKFQGAWLDGADFMHVNMRDVKLNADFSGVNMATVNLSGADLRGARWSGGDLLRVNMSGADVRGAKLRINFGSGTTLSANYGATDMTDSDFGMPFPDDAKKYMCGLIWHFPALWAKGKDIAEYSPGTVDLQLEKWDCYALAGLVRNFEHERHLKGASDIAKRARQLLDEDGKIPHESAQLIKRILPE